MCLAKMRPYFLPLTKSKQQRSLRMSSSGRTHKSQASNPKTSLIFLHQQLDLALLYQRHYRRTSQSRHSQTDKARFELSQSRKISPSPSTPPWNTCHPLSPPQPPLWSHHRHPPILTQATHRLRPPQPQHHPAIHRATRSKCKDTRLSQGRVETAVAPLTSLGRLAMVAELAV